MAASSSPLHNQSIMGTLYTPDFQEKDDSAGTWSEECLPVVDLDIIVNGDADQRSREIHHLARACEEWGFFMVINHGVPEPLKEATIDALKEMFRIHAVENNEYLIAPPTAAITLATTTTTPYWRNHVRMFTHPDMHCPEKPPNLRGYVTEYAARTRALAQELLRAISESLGLHQDRLAEALNLEDGFQFLGLNDYPAAPPRVGEIALPAHSDHGIFTLLTQSGANGLMIQKDGRWILVKPVPNSICVQCSDQLEIVSNGRFKAVMHRAMANVKEARISFVSMVGPCLDLVVQPLPELAPEAPDGVFIKYSDHIAQARTKPNEIKALLHVRRQREIRRHQGSPNNTIINAQ